MFRKFYRFRKNFKDIRFKFMINMGKITALIAVKGNSDRVKNKNIRPFANSNLLEIKLA